MKKAVIIGAGPAGLYAASALLEHGIGVDLYDGKSRPGRKLLLAGSTGLNITKRESSPVMARRYGKNGELFDSLLRDFSSEHSIEWLGKLGVSVMEGNGGKIYPDRHTAKDLLSLLMDKLNSHGDFRFLGNSRFIGWNEAGPVLEGSEGSILIKDRPVLFALGGASWPETGSDGSWVTPFAHRGIHTVPFKPMNCAFTLEWSSRFRESRIDRPLKNIALHYRGESRRGELMLTGQGLEGMPLYWFSLPLREELEGKGRALIHLDLTPDLAVDKLQAHLEKRPPKKSLTPFLRGTLRFSPQKAALIHEAHPSPGSLAPDVLARLIKALPLTLTGTGPLKRAISVSGGISLEELDENLMLRRFPGFFAAGEMIDWEAPTGGYLLQGCLSTAHRAVRGMGEYLA